MITVGSTNYLFSSGYQTTSGNGFIYTNMPGTSCFMPEYVDYSTGNPITYS